MKRQAGGETDRRASNARPNRLLGRVGGGADTLEPAPGWGGGGRRSPRPLLSSPLSPVVLSTAASGVSTPGLCSAGAGEAQFHAWGGGGRRVGIAGRRARVGPAGWGWARVGPPRPGRSGLSCLSLSGEAGRGACGGRGRREALRHSLCCWRGARRDTDR